MKVAPEIHLSDKERKTLREITRKGSSSARRHTRARILLMADAVRQRSGGERRRISNSNQTIAAELQISERTVSRVRQRYLQGGLELALGDNPRSGRPVELDGVAEAYLVALACSDPPEGRDMWTLQLLADKMVELRYVEHVSDTWVMNRLKKTNCSLGKSKAGASPR
jgi:transposase